MDPTYETPEEQLRRLKAELEKLPQGERWVSADEPLIGKYLEQAARKVEELKAQGIDWTILPHDKLMALLFPDRP